jgi:hypothetical protein
VQGRKRDLGGLEIQFRFQCEMIECGRRFQHFKFDVATQGRKKVVGLCRHRPRRRTFQGGILFQRFVVDLDRPSCAIDRGHVVRSQGFITRHQIPHTATSILVREDDEIRLIKGCSMADEATYLAAGMARSGAFSTDEYRLIFAVAQRYDQLLREQGLIDYDDYAPCEFAR